MMGDNVQLEEEWRPPTEAEMEQIRRRRERSDRISQIMSQYLLRGYKMLASICQNCDTVMLEDRTGRQFCVACTEVDREQQANNAANDAQNPITSTVQNQPVSVSSPQPIPIVHLNRPPSTMESNTVARTCMEAIRNQMNEAVQQLAAVSRQPETARQWIELIDSCAKALTSLYALIAAEQRY